ncbi:hypothetical protein FPQ18DRAFT_263792 [Pyronema domesticum]|nr:hypothetical protein FPQ18DRAFT_263792 [Pyronema domesticum]
MRTKIVEFGEVFNWEDPENLRFDYTQVVFTDGQRYFSARSPHPACCFDIERDLQEDLDILAALENSATPIPHNIWPLYSQEFTLAPEEILAADHSYVKRQSLLDFSDQNTAEQNNQVINEIRELTIREARVYKVLQHHPHSNIVEYHGCKVEDGMIVGFCLSKYSKTLSELIWENAEIDVDACLDGIKKGIDHLHSLGFIQGDLITCNIMFREGDDRARFPVIIDFDCCRKEGEGLGLKPGAYAHRDKNVRVAIRETDYKALDFFREYIAEEKAQRSGNGETNATAT